MSKPLKYLLIFVAVIAFIWTIGRLTNALQVYSVPSLANYPSIKIGDHLFATNLIKPERFEFICYYSDTTESGRQIFTHRLCGLEGDKVEIINGDLFINGHYADSNLAAHNYIFKGKEFKIVQKAAKIDENLIYEISEDSIIALVSDKTVKNSSINAVRQVLPKGYRDEYISKQYKKNWNVDNFGPVKVPKGKYFVLGDNRLNSLDSRYTGFIDRSRLVGTVIVR